MKETGWFRCLICCFCWLSSFRGGFAQLFSKHFKVSFRLLLSGRATCNSESQWQCLARICLVIIKKCNISEFLQKYYSVVFILDVHRCPFVRRSKQRRWFFASSRLLHICFRYFRLNMGRGSETVSSHVCSHFGCFADTAKRRVVMNCCWNSINCKSKTPHEEIMLQRPHMYWRGGSAVHYFLI